MKAGTSVFAIALVVTALLAALLPSVTLASDNASVIKLVVTPTNYYLPKGYKVHAQIYVPDAPIWPGENVGGAVGVQGPTCTIYAQAYGWKNSWNWFQYKSGIRVYQVCGSITQKVADVQVDGHDFYADVVITYDWDGHVTIAASLKPNAQLSNLYGFTAETDKYTIVGEGAKVDPPEALPQPTTTSASGQNTGNGYNPPTVNDLQTRYLLLGAGAGIIAVLVIATVLGRRRRVGKSVMPALILIFLILAGIGLTAYYIMHNKVYLIPGIKLTQELGPQPTLMSAKLSSIKPGQVFQVYGDKEGWQIKQKDTALYEKLNLSDVDLGVNDVVAWHGYVLYASPGQYISYTNPQSSADNSIAWQVRFKLVHSEESWNSLIFSPPESPRLNAECGTHYVFVGYDNSTSSFILVSKPGIDMLDGEWHVVAASHYSGLLNAWYDGVQQASDKADNGDAKLYDYVYLGPTNGGFTEEIAYVIVWKSGNDINGNVDVGTPLQDLEMLLDPTFYNGSAYLDLVSGTVGTPHGNPIRIPSEHPFLWLVKGLASDNKLHFEWFPSGTIVKIKDSSGNIIREFTITGTPANDDGQIANYSISLDTTTIPSATVIAYVPSNSIRVYGPYSATVEVLDNEGNILGEGTIGVNGYADIELSHEVSDGSITVVGNTVKQSGLNINVKQSGNQYTITVTDDKGSPIPGLLVRVADSSNAVVYAGTTDNAGQVTFTPTKPLPEATVDVSGVWEGNIYEVTKSIQLQAPMSVTMTATTSNSSNLWKWLLVGAFILLFIIATIALTHRRSGKSGIAVLLALAAVITVIMAPAAVLITSANTSVTKTYTINFQDQKVIYANSTLSKSYDLGYVAGNTTIEWEGKGSGNAYLTESGTTKETLDLSINGSANIQLSGGDTVINLDSNALWHGTITVTVQDTYKISVTLSRNTLSLEPGGSTTLAMTVTKISGLDRYVTLQYSAPSALSITVSPQPPYVVGQKDLTLTIKASQNAYGSYTATIYIYAYNKPTAVDPQPPSVPPVMVPWNHRPNVPHPWVMAGELDIALGSNSIPSSFSFSNTQAKYVALGIGILVIMLAAIALSKKGRR